MTWSAFAENVPIPNELRSTSGVKQLKELLKHQFCKTRQHQLYCMKLACRWPDHRSPYADLLGLLTTLGDVEALGYQWQGKRDKTHNADRLLKQVKLKYVVRSRRQIWACCYLLHCQHQEMVDIPVACVLLTASMHCRLQTASCICWRIMKGQSIWSSSSRLIKILEKRSLNCSAETLGLLCCTMHLLQVNVPSASSMLLMRPMTGCRSSSNSSAHPILVFLTMTPAPFSLHSLYTIQPWTAQTPHQAPLLGGAKAAKMAQLIHQTAARHILVIAVLLVSFY